MAKAAKIHVMPLFLYLHTDICTHFECENLSFYNPQKLDLTSSLLTAVLVTF